MTQLIIAGVETVLPQGFSVTVKRENSFFTKSGEYTYDCTLRLDNPVNQQLYGFLHRLNKSSQIDTRRTAILMADGHVYCRGTEVVTKWTEQTVSIQIVSGNSELNYFIGSSLRLEWLDLGTLNVMGYRWYDGATPVYHTSEYCLVPFRDKNGHTRNSWGYGTEYEPGDEPYTDPNNPDLDEPGGNNYHTFVYCSDFTPQPYLVDFLHHLISALGYTIGTDQLADTPFQHLFLLNTVRTTERAKMFAGWEAGEFLQEVERLCGVVFLVDNLSRTVNIVLKTMFYQESRQIPLTDVVDAYDVETIDDNGQQPDFPTSSITYQLPEHDTVNLMKLPEGFLEGATIRDYSSLTDLHNAALDVSPSQAVILHDTSTSRLYVVRSISGTIAAGTEERRYLCEVNQFADLRRETDSELEISFTPAPLLPDTDFIERISIWSSSTTSANSGSSADSTDGQSFEDSIRGYKKKEAAQKEDILVAFHNGTYIANGNLYNTPVAYTDAAHAIMQSVLYLGYWLNGQIKTDSYAAYYHVPELLGPTPVGSLRLQDLDTDYYQGGYQIDTAHAVTFETFDPNHIDVRQVYIIGNRRYVVRDVEETITAEGRQPLWRLTCYPIRISDEAIEHRWILTRGAWDDGGAWLDDGRWNDQTPH